MHLWLFTIVILPCNKGSILLFKEITILSSDFFLPPVNAQSWCWGVRGRRSSNNLFMHVKKTIRRTCCYDSRIKWWQLQFKSYPRLLLTKETWWRVMYWCLRRDGQLLSPVTSMESFFSESHICIFHLHLVVAVSAEGDLLCSSVSPLAWGHLWWASSSLVWDSTPQKR